MGRRSPQRIHRQHRRRLMQRLLNQQFWCWGQDIMHPAGNYLMETGFEKTPPPAHRSKCPSLYRLSWNERQRLSLRGFGLFLEDDELGGIYIARDNFRPLYVPRHFPIDPCWIKADLPALRPPPPEKRLACGYVFGCLARWISQYERGVIEKLGISYREQVLHRLGEIKSAIIPARAMADAWNRCAMEIGTDNDVVFGGREIPSSNKPKRSVAFRKTLERVTLGERR